MGITDLRSLAPLTASPVTPMPNSRKRNRTEPKYETSTETENAFPHYSRMSNDVTDSLILRAKELFKAVYGAEAAIISSAPGRLNFGGEHCDYMGGYVLPFPTTLVGVIAGRKTEGKVGCRHWA